MPSTPNTPITNFNPLTQIGYNVLIARLPTLSFFTKSISLPSLTVENPPQANPFSSIHLPGDMPHWGSLSIDFIVDEDLRNYEEMFKWMVGVTFPETTDQWKELVGATNTGFSPGNTNIAYSDISVQTLTSSKNANVMFTYHNCIPRSIGSIQLNTTDTDTEVVTCQAEFDFSHFTMTRI